MPDAYTVRARIAPIILAALPALALLVGGLLSPSQIAKLGSTAIAAILLFASQLARDRGRELQPALWASWGGPPTLVRFRYRGAEHPDRVARVHARAEAVFAVTLPDADEEAADPHAADVVYEDVITDLRNRTRTRDEFPLVFEENVNYGFRRNLLGLKPYALAVAILVACICTVAFALASGSTSGRVHTWAWPAALALIAALAWWRIVKPGWVRLPADEYASRLLEALDTLGRPAIEAASS